MNRLSFGLASGEHVVVEVPSAVDDEEAEAVAGFLRGLAASLVGEGDEKTHKLRSGREARFYVPENLTHDEASELLTAIYDLSDTVSGSLAEESETTEPPKTPEEEIIERTLPIWSAVSEAYSKLAEWVNESSERWGPRRPHFDSAFVDKLWQACVAESDGDVNRATTYYESASSVMLGFIITKRATADEFAVSAFRKEVLPLAARMMDAEASRPGPQLRVVKGGDDANEQTPPRGELSAMPSTLPPPPAPPLAAEAYRVAQVTLESGRDMHVLMPAGLSPSEADQAAKELLELVAQVRSFIPFADPGDPDALLAIRFVQAIRLVWNDAGLAVREWRERRGDGAVPVLTERVWGYIEELFQHESELVVGMFGPVLTKLAMAGELKADPAAIIAMGERGKRIAINGIAEMNAAIDTLGGPKKETVH